MSVLKRAVQTILELRDQVEAEQMVWDPNEYSLVVTQSEM